MEFTIYGGTSPYGHLSITDSSLGPRGTEIHVIWWPTTVTSNTNSLHQIQIPHIKIKFTTSNTNSPHQIQIHHIKYNINSPHQIQIHHIKNKFTTSNTNSPHQKQIHHIKNKFPTSKSKTQIKRSAVNERKLSPVFTRPSPDRHFVLAHYGGPQLSRQNQKSRQNKMNSRQDNINSRQNMGIVQRGTLSKWRDSAFLE